MYAVTRLTSSCIAQTVQKMMRCRWVAVSVAMDRRAGLMMLAVITKHLLRL